MRTLAPEGTRASPTGDVPALHVVTDDEVLARPDYPAVAEALMRAGGARLALHVRGPGTAGGTLLARAAPLTRVAEESGAWLVVNDRVDVALAAGVVSVQLGGRSLPVEVARTLLGPDARVGLSVHSAEEASASGALDWVFAGTIYPSATHPGRPGAGPALVAEVSAGSPGVPVVAIGGITPDRLAELAGAGAAGVAVIRGIWSAADPVAAARLYLESWPERPQPSKESE